VTAELGTHRFYEFSKIPKKDQTPRKVQTGEEGRGGEGRIPPSQPLFIN